MNQTNQYLSAKKEFRRRLILLFLSVVLCIGYLIALPFPLRHSFWAMLGLVPAFVSLAYVNAFRCPRCGGLYRGGLSPANSDRRHERGCCVQCGLCLFKKDKTNWRLQ